MKLWLPRGHSRKNATISPLLVDGVWHSFVCEDVIREVPGVPVSSWKIPGQSAIPAGTYNIVLTQSQRFHRVLPLLENVPGFAGVRLHPGNGPSDSSGCLLPGYDKFENSVGRSRLAFEELFEAMKQAIARGETVTITIENPKGLSNGKEEGA